MGGTETKVLFKQIFVRRKFIKSILFKKKQFLVVTNNKPIELQTHQQAGFPSHNH